MNNNSVICKFISEHPEDWETILTKEYDLRIKRDGDYAIFNYNITCNFHNPLIQEARGIIIDISTLEVVCWPFRKFGNYHEGYCDTIDWSSARVLEKVDGSIIKLWYDFKKDGWQFSTNGTIRAENAGVHESMLDITYGQVIEEADNYSQIPFDTLDKNTTYIFELVSPKTKVVVPYPKTSLYHLGTRSNITGLESETDIGIKKPQSYPITSLQDCIQASLALNDGASDNVEKEGFVVVDKDYHRVKIKSPDYLVLSRLTQLKMVSKSDAVELILNGKEKIEPICKANPDLIPYFKYYEFRVSELITLAGKMALLARGLYKEFDMNKGAVARVISSHRLSWFGFSALGNDRTGEELVRALPIEKLVKFFPEYELEDLRALFLNKTDK